MKPLISIVTLCRNNPEELKYTIENIIKKINFLSAEVIVVDGSDSDACKLELPFNKKIKYIRQTGRGIYSAMNEGVDNCSGLSVIFMNSGDQFYVDFDLKKFIDQYKNEIGNIIVYGDVLRVYKSFNKVVSFSNFELRKKKVYKEIPSHQAIFCPSNFLKNNKFDENLSVSADTKLMINAFTLMDSAYYPFVIAVFSLGGVSSCPKNLKSTLQHCKELVLTRKLNKIYAIKLYLTQILKLLLIKILGYERYLAIVTK